MSGSERLCDEDQCHLPHTSCRGHGCTLLVGRAVLKPWPKQMKKWRDGVRSRALVSPLEEVPGMATRWQQVNSSLLRPCRLRDYYILALGDVNGRTSMSFPLPLHQPVSPQRSMVLRGF